jgi:hypothetical protein
MDASGRYERTFGNYGLSVPFILTTPFFFFDQIYLPEWAWALAERNELGLLLDPRLEGERKEHAESMERMTRVRNRIHSSCRWLRIDGSDWGTPLISLSFGS